MNKVCIPSGTEQRLGCRQETPRTVQIIWGPVIQFEAVNEAHLGTREFPAMAGRQHANMTAGGNKCTGSALHLGMLMLPPVVRCCPRAGGSSHTPPTSEETADGAQSGRRIIAWLWGNDAIHARYWLRHRTKTTAQL